VLRLTITALVWLGLAWLFASGADIGIPFALVVIIPAAIILLPLHSLATATHLPTQYELPILIGIWALLVMITAMSGLRLFMDKGIEAAARRWIWTVSLIGMACNAQLAIHTWDKAWGMA
jgi:hypothetical protein